MENNNVKKVYEENKVDKNKLKKCDKENKKFEIEDKLDIDDSSLDLNSDEEDNGIGYELKI